MTIYKVFFQPDSSQALLRENTETIYVEAASDVEVRKFLADRPYNIELIQALESKHLDYERTHNPDFKVEQA